jgi:hypothetical protein
LLPQETFWLGRLSSKRRKEGQTPETLRPCRVKDNRKTCVSVFEIRQVDGCPILRLKQV